MRKLAVFFPGIGYTTDRPLLHFARCLADKLGYNENRKLSYQRKGKEDIRNNPDAMEKTILELYEQAKNELSDIDWSLYDDVLFISKSIGTAVASIYAQNNKIDNVKHVMYTPLTITFDYNPSNAIAFIGTNDSWSDLDDIKTLANDRGIMLEIYEGCNHSMETDDVFENMDILKDIIQKTEKFLR